MNTFKIVLIGPSQSGKTTFLNRSLTGEFLESTTPTLGVEIDSLRFHTNYGGIFFNIWDCAGNDKFGGLRDGYYIGAQGCILMVDLTQPHLIQQLQPWLKDIYRIVPDCHIVICGNKCDLKGSDANEIAKLFQYGNDDYPIHKGVTYYDVSAQNTYGMDRPFLNLARRLLGHDDLIFL